MPTNNIKILFRNVLDYPSSTMVNQTNATNMGQSNLTHPGRHYVFRSDGELEPEFNFNLAGGAETITDVFVFHTNLETDATIRTILYDAANQTGSILYDSTAESVLISGNTAFQEDNKHIHQTFAAVNSVLSGKFRLSDLGNPDGYIQCSRCFIGECWEPAVGASTDSSWGWDDTAEQIRTQGNSLRSSAGGSFRTLNLQFAVLSQQEALDLMDHARYVGQHRDFAITLYQEATGQPERDFIIQCKFRSAPTIKPLGGSYYSATLSLVEV